MSISAKQTVAPVASVKNRLKNWLRGPDPLLEASYRGNLNVVTALIAAGADPNAARPVPAGSPFVWEKAPVYGHVEAGSTPLLVASERGHLDVVRALIAAGADVNANVVIGWKPLQVASADGNLGMVTALIAAGADVNADIDGDTPLQVASEQGHLGVVAALTAAGADVNAEDVNGATALLWAYRRGHLDVVMALIAAGTV
jgi:ankyrin repeat protein